jgi:glucan-binding YG repeat protein
MLHQSQVNIYFLTLVLETEPELGINIKTDDSATNLTSTSKSENDSSKDNKTIVPSVDANSVEKAIADNGIKIEQVEDVSKNIEKESSKPSSSTQSSQRRKSTAKKFKQSNINTSEKAIAIARGNSVYAIDFILIVLGAVLCLLLFRLLGQY